MIFLSSNTRRYQSNFDSFLFNWMQTESLLWNTTQKLIVLKELQQKHQTYQTALPVSVKIDLLEKVTKFYKAIWCQAISIFSTQANQPTNQPKKPKNQN